MEKNYRYGTYELQTTCAYCGNPLMLNAPRLKTHCPSCLKDVEVPPPVWKSLLEDVEKEYHKLKEGEGSSGTMMTGGFTFSYRAGRRQPQCQQCNAVLSTANIATGHRGTVTCPECGHGNSSAPVPSWLKERLPSAGQIFCAEEEHTASPLGSGSPFDLNNLDADPVLKAVKPVVMQCPQCGAGLSIGTHNERLTPCASCGSEVFIPDPVWHRLHPVKTVQKWTVRFEGPSWVAIRERLKADKKAERRQKKEQELALRSVRYKELLKNYWLPELLTLAGGLMVALFLTLLMRSGRFTEEPAWVNPLFIGGGITWLVGFVWGLGSGYRAVESMDNTFKPDMVLFFFPTLMPLVGVVWSTITIIDSRSKIRFEEQRVSNPLTRHLTLSYLMYHGCLTAVFIAAIAHG